MTKKSLRWVIISAAVLFTGCGFRPEILPLTADSSIVPAENLFIKYGGK